jgi:hypothetical protein
MVLYLSSVKLDEATWDALNYLSKRLGIDPNVIAGELLRPLIQYIKFFIARADIAELCGDIIPIKEIEFARIKKLEMDKAIIKKYIIKPAAIILGVRKVYKQIKYLLSLNINELKENLRNIGIGKETLEEGLKMLSALNFIKIENQNVIFINPPEFYERFIDCATRVEKMYGLRTLGVLLRE